MPRLDKERQSQLEPKRINQALDVINGLGLKVTSVSKTEIKFIFKEHTVTFFPYSGWHTGKPLYDDSISDLQSKNEN